MSDSLPLSSIQADDEWLQRWTAAEGGFLTSLGWWIMALRPFPLRNPSESVWLFYKGSPVNALPLTGDRTLSQLGGAGHWRDILWHYRLESGCVITRQHVWLLFSLWNDKKKSQQDKPSMANPQGKNEQGKESEENTWNTFINELPAWHRVCVLTCVKRDDLI